MLREPGDILRIHDAAVQVGLAHERVALLGGLPHALTSAIPSAPDPSGQLLVDLHCLNALQELPGGDVPLRVWLTNAVALCGPREEARVFRDAMERASPIEAAAGLEGLGSWAKDPLVLEKLQQAAKGLIVPMGASRRWRRPAAVIAAVVAVIALVAGLWRPPLGSTDIVVVAEPASGEALCKRLRGVGAAPRRCTVRARATVAEASAAHASLLIAVAPDGATIQPINAPWLEALLRGMPLVDLAEELAAPKLHALAVLAASGDPVLEPKDCPKLEKGPLDRLSLLVSLFVPACFPDKIDPQRLQAVCSLPGADADPTCQLARLLYAERNPELEPLLEPGPETIGFLARLKLARHRCDAGDVDGAVRDLMKLSNETAGCRRVALTTIAACVMVSPPKDVSPAVRELEAAPVADRKECPELARARVLGERAFRRGRAGRWAAAAEDYGAAYRLAMEPLYALGQVEALLHQDQPKPALARLDALRNIELNQRSDAFYDGLLRWVAARQAAPHDVAAEADALVRRYGKLSDGEVAYPEEDPDLRRLACSDRPDMPCSLDVLTKPKSDAGVEALRLSLSTGR